MKHESGELISALMDGETSEFEFRRSLELMKQEPEQAAKWQRYHLARSALRREPFDAAGLDLTQRIHTALEQEGTHTGIPADSEHQTQVRPGWLRSVTSMAMAASVTAVVILGAQYFNNGSVPVGTPSEMVAQAPQPHSYQLPATSQRQIDGYMRTQYGQLSSVHTAQANPDVIRFPGTGVDRYIEQHQHLQDTASPQWTADWLPNGFEARRHEVMSKAEVMVYSDGRHAVSVSIEPWGQQSMAEGIVHVDDVVAVARRKGEHFVTVVGDVPMMIAERIAASVRTVE